MYILQNVGTSVTVGTPAKVGTNRYISEKVGTSKSRYKQAQFRKSRHLAKVGTNRHNLEKVGT